MKKKQLSGRLCILVNSLAGGGGEKVALTLFEEYRRQGLDVVLLCLEKNDVHSAAHTDVCYLSEQTGQREGGLTKLFSLLGFAFKLKRFIREKNIGLVQSHLYRANYVNVLARKLGAGHKVQIANHGIASRYFGEGLPGRVNLFLIRRLYPAADQILCPSVGMLSDLQHLLGEVGRQIYARVVGNPFDIEFILRRSKEDVTKDEFFFLADRRYLVSVGRLEKVKGPEHLVQALHGLVGRHPDLELLMLGTGAEKENIQLLARRLGVDKKVHLLGQVDNPFKYLARSDIFVSASSFEGFSNVIVEAMISGIAVISTDCPSGPREILSPDSREDRQLRTGESENAEFGILVPVDDGNSMTAAIDDLLQDNDKRRWYTMHGIDGAKRFDTTGIAEKYLQGF